MALPSPDPVQAVFQLLALSEAEGPDAEDRVLLDELKAGLRAVKELSSPAEWLRWYRRVLEVARTLQGRWQTRRTSAATPNAPADASPLTAVAAGRLRDASAGFVQRWGQRLQDQSHQVRAELLPRVEEASVTERVVGQQTVFELTHEVRTWFGNVVAGTLNQWSVQVAQSLTPSWHDWLMSIMAEERVPRAVLAPPPWANVNLATSAQLIPHVEPGAARRITALSGFQRALSAMGGLLRTFGPAIGVFGFLGGLIGVGAGKATDVNVAGSSAIGATAGGAIGIVIGVPLAIWYFRAQRKDEEAAARRDHTQRQRAALTTWLGTAVDAHRQRMLSALQASSTDMKLRMAPWVEQSWPGAPTSGRPSGAPSDTDRELMTPLLSALSMARGAIASRATQLELEQPGVAR